MTQFRLNYNEQKIFQLSNDAFFYLAYGEEVLDEDNLEEAQEIADLFPNGFYIEDNWEYIENSDLIQATFVPYIIDDFDFDEYENLTNDIQHQIKWLGPNLIRAWWYYPKSGKRKLRGDFKVYTNQFGARCFHTGDQEKDFAPGKSSKYFLKHFRKKGA